MAIPAWAFAALFLLYAPLFFRGVIFYSADSFAFYFTTLKYWFGELHQYGTMALWNPYTNLGTSFLYNTTNGFFYPLHGFGYFFGTLTFFQLLWVTHLFLLLAGAMRWAKRVGASFENRLLVVVLFVASPFTSLFGVAGFNYLYAMVWSVWILGELDTPDEKQIKLWRLLPAWALLITCGEPITMMYVGAFTFFQLWKRKGLRSLAAFVACSGVVGLFVYGHGILALSHSTRKAGLTLDWILSFSFHPARLLTYFSPYFFGHPVHRTFVDSWVNTAPSTPRFLFDTPYLPSALLLLILAGMVAAYKERRTSPRSWPWLIGVVVALLLSFGRLGPMLLLAHVPPFSMFRYPEKWIIIATLMALHFAFRREGNFLDGLRRPWAKAVMLAGITMPCLSLSTEYPIALASAGVFAAVLAYERGKLTHRRAVWALFAMGILQAFFGLAPERSMPIAELDGDTDIARYIKSIIPEATLNRFEITPQAAGNDFPHKYMIYGTNMLTRRSTVFGYDSFMTPFLDTMLKRLTGDATRFTPSPKEPIAPDAMRAFMNLTNLTAMVVADDSPIRTLLATVREDANVFAIRHQENGWTALGPKTPTASLWWFPQLEQAVPDSDLIHWPPTVEKRKAFMRGLEWEWDKPAPACDVANAAPQPWGEKSVKWTGRNQFDFQFEAPCAGWVFFSETMLPGWRLYLNGVEQPLHKANRTFVAFPIPKGVTNGYMQYVPFRTLYEGFVGRFVNPL